MAAERAIEITAGLIDLARADNKVPPTVPKQKICFDEWNVWDMFRAPGEQGAEEQYVSENQSWRQSRRAITKTIMAPTT